MKLNFSETSLQRTPSGPQNSVHYREVSAIQIAYFASKTSSGVLGYSAIDPKVCQETDVERTKPKDNLLEDIMFLR